MCLKNKNIKEHLLLNKTFWVSTQIWKAQSDTRILIYVPKKLKTKKTCLCNLGMDKTRYGVWYGKIRESFLSDERLTLKAAHVCLLLCQSRHSCFSQSFIRTGHDNTSSYKHHNVDCYFQVYTFTDNLELFKTKTQTYMFGVIHP